MASARDLHAQAIEAREKKQDFEKALKLTDEAIIACGEENNSEELSGILGSRQNIFGHFYEKTNDKSYLILAKHSAMAAVEIAESSNASAALPYRDLAKAYEKLKDYKNAVINYEKAINSNLPEEHDRPAVKADIKAHLAYSKYKTGDKTGLDLMNEAISELNSAQEQRYEKDVWLSGAHMRAAEMLRQDNSELAKEHLQKAKEIIDANNELVLRKNQWEKLNKLFT